MSTSGTPPPKPPTHFGDAKQQPNWFELSESPRKNKRFRAVFAGGAKTDFGSPGGLTYIDGAPKEAKDAYLARHSKTPGEDWGDMKTAGALSRWLLWGKSPSLAQNLESFNAVDVRL